MWVWSKWDRLVVILVSKEIKLVKFVLNDCYNNLKLDKLRKQTILCWLVIVNFS